MINELRKLNYEDRLVKTGLVTLKERRTRGDMIEVFKIVNGTDNLDSAKYIRVADNSWGEQGDIFINSLSADQD